MSRKLHTARVRGEWGPKKAIAMRVRREYNSAKLMNPDYRRGCMGIHNGVYMLLDVPSGLHRAVKMRAAAERLTLKNWVIKELAAAVARGPADVEPLEGGEIGVRVETVEG
jgi:hypothetical protein